MALLLVEAGHFCKIAYNLASSGPIVDSTGSNLKFSRSEAAHSR